MATEAITDHEGAALPGRHREPQPVDRGEGRQQESRPGELDQTVPWAIANASYKRQKHEGVTEIVEMPGLGHAPTIDSGWREVADTALASCNGSPDPTTGGGIA